MMRAAAVRMCFPSPSGFWDISETGNVTAAGGGVTADDRGVSEVSDMIRCFVLEKFRRIIPTDAIRVRLWTVNCLEKCAMNGRMPKAEERVRK